MKGGDPSSSEWVEAFSEQVTELQRDEGWTLEVVDDLTLDMYAGCKTHKQTSAFARFQCSKCGRKWPSNHVFILFGMKRGHPERRRGLVQMRIFKQKCNRCLIFNKPHFSSKNIRRALGNLLRAIRIKCYEEWTLFLRRPRALEHEVHTTGHHRSDLCEACEANLCPLKGRWSVVTTSLVHARHSAHLLWWGLPAVLVCFFAVFLYYKFFAVFLYYKIPVKPETNWEKFVRTMNNIFNKLR